MTGPQLHKYIKTNKIHKGNLSVKSGIPERTLGEIYGYKVIAPHHLKRLRDAIEALTGVADFDKPTMGTKINGELANYMVQALELTIKDQSKKIKSQGERIKKLEEEVNILQDRVDLYEKSNKKNVSRKN